jgi:hypothetical protein
MFPTNRLIKLATCLKQIFTSHQIKWQNVEALTRGSFIHKDNLALTIVENISSNICKPTELGIFVTALNPLSLFHL